MKPTHYVVHWSTSREYIANRTRARWFAAAKRLQGFKVRIEAKGF